MSDRDELVEKCEARVRKIASVMGPDRLTGILQSLATAAAEREREACASFCERQGWGKQSAAAQIADKIRQRGGGHE